MRTPKDIQIIGQELAILWNDHSESYFRFDLLRAASPSAEHQGERDIFGKSYGGVSKNQNFGSVTILAFELVGNYALRFNFSDGHRTGLYSFDYLTKIENASTNS